MNPANPAEEGDELDDGEDGAGGNMVGPGGNGVGESNISGFDEDSASMFPNTAGKSRFDVLLKSLIARIEFSGTLAPI